NGKTLAAPEPPRRDHAPTIGGAHPVAEAVHALAPPIMRLKCTLHDFGFETTPNYSTHLPPAQWRGGVGPSAFGVRRSAFGVRRWAFGVGRAGPTCPTSPTGSPNAERRRPNAKGPTPNAEGWGYGAARALLPVIGIGTASRMQVG